jgi:DNA-binding transcriptional LysR family regulator
MEKDASFVGDLCNLFNGLNGANFAVGMHYGNQDRARSQGPPVMKSFAAVMEVRNTEAIKRMVSEGLGVSVLSSQNPRPSESQSLA